MSDFEPEKPLGPQPPVLDYQPKQGGRARARRSYAKAGGVRILLWYPCLIFARLAFDFLVGIEDSDNLIYYLTLPCSMVPGPYGNPLMEWSLIAFLMGLALNAALWASLWAVPAFIWQLKLEGKPLTAGLFANARQSAPGTKRRRS